MAKAITSKPFAHLHVHSQYSLLDGACRTADLVQRAKELEQPAIALTDHGCLFGVIEFYSLAVKAGIKPILGLEAYMAPGSRLDRTTTGLKDSGYHLLLLAQNHCGYLNLLKLASIAYTEGFYYKPRIDFDVLKTHSEGLIATSACIGGQIPMALLAHNRKKADQIADQYLSLFGSERFYIELQKHIPEQDLVNPELMDLADRKGFGCIASNDVHFLLETDHAPHDALCCISTGKLLTDESRLHYPRELYLKSSIEMYEAMDHPKWIEACENTLTVAQMCNVDLKFGTNHAPVVRVARLEPNHPHRDNAVNQGQSDLANGSTPSKDLIGSTEWYTDLTRQFQVQPFDATQEEISPEELKGQCDLALRDLAEAGLLWRYGREHITPAHRDRLEHELTVLAEKNISAYFLIVWDFVSEARRRGIPACARGSGIGTMVGYVLGLSNACPVKYGLLFERFTDPDRSEYPDIDVDICQDGRQQIIDYVRQKYGHVAQIITFGTLKARAAIRDVGRVLDVSLAEVDKVCKLVGDSLGTTIDSALQQNPDLLKLYNEEERIQSMIDTARRLEGLARHAGVHAAGVVIATQPLEHIVPLYQPPNTDQVVTQWDGPTVDKIGLLKMDFLGLRTLSVIERTKQLIQEIRTEQDHSDTKTHDLSLPETSKPTIDLLDLDRLSYDDPSVFKLFGRGETSGVFQFESGGMRNLLMAMKPDRLEDLIAANALYRPGPMDLIPVYNDRKHGRRDQPKVHPIVDKHTTETYGVMVYQEQVMLIVHELGGIPLRSAYTLIKAISKKNETIINASRDQFIEGAAVQGLPKARATELFELVLKFAGYGFNKSHSTGYAIIAYQTAYLKTYYPLQYMAALLTYESVSLDKVVEYIDECKRVRLPNGRRGIDVKPPDINQSDIAFTVVHATTDTATDIDEQSRRTNDSGCIRFGLSAVKGVGDKAIRGILNERDKNQKKAPFTSLYDFCERVPLGAVNRATIEALIKCGAFDTLHGIDQRAAMIEGLDRAIQAGQRAAADRDSGQMSIFGTTNLPTSENPRPTATEAPLPKTTSWPRNLQLKHEKEVLGFYLSSHPLDDHAETINRYATCTISEAKELKSNTPIVLGGMLNRIRLTVTRKKQQKMAVLTIEDRLGSIEAVAFPEAYAKYADLLDKDRILFLIGRIDLRREEPSLLVEQVVSIDRAAESLTQAVRIILRDSSTNQQGSPFNGAFGRLREVLVAAAPIPGRPSIPVLMELHQTGKTVTLRLSNRVAVDKDLAGAIENVFTNIDEGTASCELVGPTKIKFGPTQDGSVQNDLASTP